jgi:hypothetical protein
MDNAKKLKEIRNALADYMASEGCGCCRNQGAHTEAATRLAKLLRVPKYDGGGHQFAKFKSIPPKGSEL